MIRTDGVLFRPAEGWSGMTEKNNLAKLRLLKPEWGSSIMTQLESINSQGMSYENYLKSVVSEVGIKKTDDPINYMVYGEGDKNAKLMGYKADNPNKVGFNKSRFLMYFDKPLFSDVHVIVGMDDRYRVRVVSDPRSEGSLYVYECEVFGPADDFIPASELRIGGKWSRDGAPVPLSKSKKGAKTYYSSPYAIQFNWSSVRIEDEVPGNMKNRPVAFSWKVKTKGGIKTVSTWEQYRTWKNDLHFSELKNKTLLWGRSNRNADGGYDDIDEKSGEEIIQEAGYVQQVERGNLKFYNSFDIEEFSDHILQSREGKDMSDKTHYVVSTGTHGLIQAHSSIVEKIGALGWEPVDNISISGTKENAGFGTRFTRYMHPGGFYIDFRYEPMLDDNTRTPKLHPNGGYARSYEYHVMDLGQTQGENNVEINYVESAQDLNAVVSGIRNPFSPGLSKNMQQVASGTDAWTEHRMSQFMIAIKNSKDAMIYRPNVPNY